MAIAVAVIQGNAPVIFKNCVIANRFSPLPLANGCLYDTGCLFSLFTGHSQKTRSCTQWVYSTRPGHFLTKPFITDLNTSDQDLITRLFMACFYPHSPIQPFKKSLLYHAKVSQRRRCCKYPMCTSVCDRICEKETHRTCWKCRQRSALRRLCFWGTFEAFFAVPACSASLHSEYNHNTGSAKV